MGAWIETNHWLPTVHTYKVAPHVGAWIETYLWTRSSRTPVVAPHVGAWIETTHCISVSASSPSRPTWARGLKPILNLQLE